MTLEWTNKIWQKCITQEAISDEWPQTMVTIWTSKCKQNLQKHHMTTKIKEADVKFREEKNPMSNRRQRVPRLEFAECVAELPNNIKSVPVYLSSEFHYGIQSCSQLSDKHTTLH